MVPSLPSFAQRTKRTQRQRHRVWPLGRSLQPRCRNALKVAKQVQSGMCHINGRSVHDEAQMPFGGVKASGYSRFGGKTAIAEFTDLRLITVEPEPGHFPI